MPGRRVSTTRTIIGVLRIRLNRTSFSGHGRLSRPRPLFDPTLVPGCRRAPVPLEPEAAAQSILRLLKAPSLPRWRRSPAYLSPVSLFRAQGAILSRLGVIMHRAGIAHCDELCRWPGSALPRHVPLPPAPKWFFASNVVLLQVRRAEIRTTRVPSVTVDAGHRGSARCRLGAPRIAQPDLPSSLPIRARAKHMSVRRLVLFDGLGHEHASPQTVCRFCRRSGGQPSIARLLLRHLSGCAWRPGVRIPVLRNPARRSILRQPSRASAARRETQS